MPNPYTEKMHREMVGVLLRGGKVWALAEGARCRVHKVALIPDATDDGPWFSGVMGGGTPVRFTAFQTSED